jgi:uncharacterized protein
LGPGAAGFIKANSQTVPRQLAEHMTAIRSDHGYSKIILAKPAIDTWPLFSGRALRLTATPARGAGAFRMPTFYLVSDIPVPPAMLNSCIGKEVWPMSSLLFHEGNRRLQDQFDSRRIADRLEKVTLRQSFSEEDRAFIESAEFFFLATADASGRPDCSFKGGAPGFVRITAQDELAFPDYDGNGMFKSLGNILVNSNVGLLFMAMGERPKRVRVNGSATVSRDDPEIGAFVGAQLLVRVKAQAIFPNCPRYIPDRNGPSVYIPREGVPPVEPSWKTFEVFRDAVPPRAHIPALHNEPG